METSDEPVLNKPGHASFSLRCILGLPGTMVEADPSRIAVGFYSLGSLDIIQMLDKRTKEADRNLWREWIWAQQVERRASSSNEADAKMETVGGFRPGPFMDTQSEASDEASSSDPPHLIMTYAALLALAILRDDFSNLNRTGLINLLKQTQMADGSFTTIPGRGEADMRMVYTAFAISSMVDDWSGVNVEKAISFIKSCLTYEGGFGQAPGDEAQGGTTYCALASLHLVPPQYAHLAQLSPTERRKLLRWLTGNQCANEGGFRGRTEKTVDACYSFWCGASLSILGAGSLMDELSNAAFLHRCQFRPGGIAKEPDAHSDPYHTFLSLASLAIYSPGEDAHESWALPRLDPLLNATEETAKWAREKISRKE